MEKVFRSKILKNFSSDLLVDLYRLSEVYDIDTNTKCQEIAKLLDDYKIPYGKLGPGTNRYAVLIDGYAIKIALDKVGRIDNQREFRYAKKLYPYVVKGYEISGEGLLLVTEYVTVFSLDDFYKFEPEMRDLLEKIGEVYYIADVGIDGKNYANYGLRDGSVVVILDYAYVYNLLFNNFKCDCGGVLGYNRNYTGLICPLCNKTYTFSNIRRRISKEDERKEIGDLTELGYVQNTEVAKHEIDPNKTEIILDNNKTKKIKKKKNVNFNNNLTPAEQMKLLDDIFK